MFGIQIFTENNQNNGYDLAITHSAIDKNIFGISLYKWSVYDCVEVLET